MRIKTRRGVFALVVLALVLAAFLGVVPAAYASPVVTTQLAICLDGSGSIDSTEWGLMIGGLAQAVGDPNIMPQSGIVELSIVQFADNIPGGARVELPATVITSANVASVVAAINAIPHAGGLTPLAAGIVLATAQITGSPNYGTATWQMINISTNGNPNVPSTARQAAEDAVTAAVAAGVDEVDVEGIGTYAETVEWMAQDLVYPDGEGGAAGAVIPPDSYPPRPPSPDFMGFVRVVDSFADYAQAIAEKLALIPSIILEPPTDLNTVGDQHTVVATLLDGLGNPIVGASVDFTVTGANPTGGSNVTDANGQATFTYTGMNAGLDTIVATSGTLTSNPVEKEWEAGPTPVPGMTGWGIMGSTLALALAAAVLLRRRMAYQLD